MTRAREPALMRETREKARERSVERRLQTARSDAADARRDAAGRDRDARRARLHDRLHRDVAVGRLIDRAQQVAVPVGEIAQPRRERCILRCRDHEERAGNVGFVTAADR
jgi:hypothetical protein